MAPKAKSKGKKKKEKSNEGSGNGNLISEEEKLKSELIVSADTMYSQTTKEDVAFNEYQQQREKLNYFWIVEKKKLEDKKAALRNKERELQDLEERHQVEIKVYKQRVKHLLYEHQDEITNLKTNAETSLQLTESGYRAAESDLKVDQRGLKLDLKEMELSHEDYLKSLKQEQDKKISLLRQEFERTSKEIQLKFERQRKSIRDELESRRRKQIQKIEDCKNAHISQLMNAHEKAFGEIKNYYNDITHNNLDLIKSLKEDVAEMKKKEAQDEKLMFEIAQENKRMSEPLKKALEDVERLRKNLEIYHVDKSELQDIKSKLLVTEQDYNSLSWEHEILLQRFQHVKTEKDELFAQFQKSVYDVQQKNGFKNLLLEKKVQAMDHVVERKDAQLNEVLAHAQLDPSIIGQVKHRMGDIMEGKDQTYRDLQMELERVQQLQRELTHATQSKFTEYGIPTEELGFDPLVPVPTNLIS